MDTIIRNGTVITLDGARRVMRNGNIGIENGRIASIDGEAVAPDHPEARLLDATKMIVLPGLVNPHVHLSLSLARGRADDVPFRAWLPAVYAVEDGYSADQWRITTLLSAAELLKSGTTCFADTNVYEEFDVVADAVLQTGLRAVLGKNIRDVDAEQEVRTPWLRRGADRELSLAAALDHHARYDGRGDGRLTVRLAPAVWPACSTEGYHAVGAVATE